MVYVKTVEKALTIVEAEPQLRERMWTITRRAAGGARRPGLRHRGYPSLPSRPVYVVAGDEKTAMTMIAMLREEFGVFVSAVTYPVVPRGVILFRMIPTASHTEEDVDQTVSAFGMMRDAMKLDLSTKPSQLNR